MSFYTINGAHLEVEAWPCVTAVWLRVKKYFLTGA